MIEICDCVKNKIPQIHTIGVGTVGVESVGVDTDKSSRFRVVLQKMDFIAFLQAS